MRHLYDYTPIPPDLIIGDWSDFDYFGDIRPVGGQCPTIIGITLGANCQDKHTYINRQNLLFDYFYTKVGDTAVIEPVGGESYAFRRDHRWFEILGGGGWTVNCFIEFNVVAEWAWYELVQAYENIHSLHNVTRTVLKHNGIPADEREGIFEYSLVEDSKDPYSVIHQGGTGLIFPGRLLEIEYGLHEVPTSGSDQFIQINRQYFAGPAYPSVTLTGGVATAIPHSYEYKEEHYFIGSLATNPMEMPKFVSGEVGVTYTNPVFDSGICSMGSDTEERVSGDSTAADFIKFFLGQITHIYAAQIGAYTGQCAAFPWPRYDFYKFDVDYPIDETKGVLDCGLCYPLIFFVGDETTSPKIIETIDIEAIRL
jgi:hypothetical protein